MAELITKQTPWKHRERMSDLYFCHFKSLTRRKSVWYLRLCTIESLHQQIPSFSHSHNEHELSSRASWRLAIRAVCVIKLQSDFTWGTELTQRDHTPSPDLFQRSSGSGAISGRGVGAVFNTLWLDSEFLLSRTRVELRTHRDAAGFSRPHTDLINKPSESGGIINAGASRLPSCLSLYLCLPVCAE